MSTYKAKKINRLGDYDPKYGQRYWGEVHDAQMSVAFNLMQENVDIPEGATLEFEERIIKETGPNSKNPGSEYIFLKKVKVVGQQSLTAPPVQNDSFKTLELIYSDVQKILKLVETPKSLGESWRETTGQSAEEITPGKVKPVDTVPDTVIEDIGDGPINLDDIPF